MSSLTLNFGGVNLPLVNMNDDQIWITSADLARALGYKKPDSVTRIYNRNKVEFSPSMSQTLTVTETVNLTARESAGNLSVTTRIFSLRGCHLIAMFSRTEVAQKFRAWVLDLIDAEIEKSKQQLPMGRLQQMRDENRARYAVGFSKASVGGKAMNEWRSDKRVLDAELLVIDNLMQPQLPNIEVLK